MAERFPFGMPDPFDSWSPAALAHALGYRVDLRTQSGGQRSIYLIGPTGRDHLTGHERAWRTLSRLARWRRIDPTAIPWNIPRALIDGRERVDA